MILTLTGKATDKAKVKLDLHPYASSTAIRGSGPDASVFPADGTEVDVGAIEVTVMLTLSFYRRPWSVDVVASVSAASGQGWSTTSERQGLPNRILVTPDVLPVTIQFKKVEG